MALAVLAGASAQRLTGMGFALVASPLLVLLLGPNDGVTLTQVNGLAVSALLLVSVWRDVEWRTLAWILPAALVGMVPGLWLVRALPGSVLQILVGTMVILALLATISSERARVFKGRAGATGAGFLSGFMNMIAGLGGPAIVLYRLSVNWAQAPFVATLQVYFVALSGATVAARGVPDLSAVTWGVIAAALVAGLVIGEVLARLVPERIARLLTVAVAMLGGVATVIKGIASL